MKTRAVKGCEESGDYDTEVRITFIDDDSDEVVEHMRIWTQMCRKHHELVESIRVESDGTTQGE